MSKYPEDEEWGLGWQNKVRGFCDGFVQSRKMSNYGNVCEKTDGEFEDADPSEEIRGEGRVPKTS